MKYLVILLALVLGGCSTVVPVTQRWPEAPGLQATTACKPLEKLGTAPQLSDVAQTVANNYNEYWNCSIKLDAWIEWYQKQKIIHEGLK